jgi:hypothetical protein
MTTATKSNKKLPVGIKQKEKVKLFDEKFKWPGTNWMITFDGFDFQKWVYNALPMCCDVKPLNEAKARKVGINVGEFVFYMRPLPMWRWGNHWEDTGYFGIPITSELIPKRVNLEIYRNRQTAYCGFDTEINIPILAKPDRRGKLQPWMSLTPNEVLSQRGQIRRAKKNTAMAGLGLGWAARKVLERKQVDHLTVYEKSQDIIDMFGKSLVCDYPDKVTLVCADAYEVDWHQHDVSLWDIWSCWGNAAWDNEFAKIRYTLEQDGRICVGWGQGVQK